MKFLLTLCLFLFPMTTPANANNQNDVILVHGDSLSMMFLIHVEQDDTIAITTLPSSLLVPAICAKKQPVTISSINDTDCLISSLEAVYPITITNHLALHTDAIEADYPPSKPANQLQSFEEMQTYFNDIGTSINISVLWKLFRYVDYDLSFSQVYDLYQIYTDDDFSIDYYFLHLIQIDPTHVVSLDRQFYQDKQR